MARTTYHRCLAAAVAILLTTAAVVEAQVGTEPPGAGESPSEEVGAGLEQQTPSPLVDSPDDVQLYLPIDDQLIGRVTIPDGKLATLVQPEGRLWRTWRQDGLYWTGLVLILVTIVALAGFYLWRGRIRIESGRAGRWVPRFNAVERFAHWTAALSFIALAITGLIVTFGRWALIPVMGHDAFTATSQAAKYVHNFSGTPFVFALAFMLVAWVRDNVPNRADLDWLRHAGGIMKGSSYHPETGRFNAGQKGIFWAVILGGAALAITGYLMLLPFAVTGVSGMQWFHVIHGLLAVLMIAIILVHIYLGTLGMEGAFDAMGRGEVDENWAREHHAGWYRSLRRGGRGAAPTVADAPAARDAPAE